MPVRKTNGPEHVDHFLDQACDGQPEVKSEIARLLLRHEHAGDFLVQPALQTSSSLTDGEWVAVRRCGASQIRRSRRFGSIKGNLAASDRRCISAAAGSQAP